MGLWSDFNKLIIMIIRFRDCIISRKIGVLIMMTSSDCEISLDLLRLRLLIFSPDWSEDWNISALLSIVFHMTKYETELNWTELNYKVKPIMTVLAKWFLSDFFINTPTRHTTTMGLNGKNILKPIVIFLYFPPILYF